MCSVDDESRGVHHKAESRRIGVGHVNDLVLPVASKPYIMPRNSLSVGNDPWLIAESVAWKSRYGTMEYLHTTCRQQHLCA